MSNLFITVEPGGTVNILVAGSEEADSETAPEPVIDTRVRYAEPKMSDGQRAVLFGNWNDVFGRNTTRSQRHEFTRAVLGQNVDPSWARTGSLTEAQVSRLIDTLAFFETYTV